MSQHIDAVAKQSDLDTLNGKISQIVRRVEVDISGTQLTQVDGDWHYAQINLSEYVPSGYWIIGIATTTVWDAEVIILPLYPNTITLRCQKQKTIGSNRKIEVYYA